jgi:hypothetical protein
VIERALIHVGGPPGSGKTAFIEAMLAGTAPMVLAARCLRNDSLAQAQETRPRTHPELRRYRQAGAAGAVVFAFPGHAIGSDDFFMTDLMMNYSHAVVLEGDSPLEFVDLRVFVAPAPSEGQQLFVRRTGRPTPDDGGAGTVLSRLLSESDSVVDILGKIGGAPLAELASKNPDLVEKMRASLRGASAEIGRVSPPRPAEHWSVADGYAGIEHAQLVVVNARGAGDRRTGERLVAELVRLRKDKELSTDILGAKGSRIPITAVVADLADPDDPRRNKALTRTRRAIRARSS